MSLHQYPAISPALPSPLAFANLAPGLFVGSGAGLFGSGFGEGRGPIITQALTP
ncbi:hypothetical protein PTT_12181 [Pyrenophora teres f. teres 0-1]|uniref:Uncharacterized protein n=1 Tax=Pyrenophora teres f. teres (strain 0-1) TaxID=861557 RepID=E3RT67_PYRTT|nr:hypothetical protein PTT_12181 [Pyrenophora teres f. teres 0-1]